MNVARLAAAPLAVALSFLSGCSDPPSPPAQGAITLKVGVTSGKICSHTSPQLSMPADSVASVIQELSCDLSSGCKPDDFVVVDRDRGATVQCTVAPDGDKWKVAVRLSVDGTATGTESLSFSMASSIPINPGGDTTPVSVSEQNSEAKGGGTDNSCTLSINSPHGLIKQGGIWGSVHCEDFRDVNDISETGCTLDALFLFENCAG
jgi:hypothetical protein